MGLSRRIKHVYHRVDYSAGKKIFGNTVGVKNNLSGSLKSIQKNSSDLNVKNRSQISELIKNQVLLLKNPYDSELIEIIREKYNNLIGDTKTSYETGVFEGKAYSRHINKVQDHIQELPQLITDDIVEIVQGYYQGNFNVRYIGAWRNFHVPKDIEEKTELFSNNWHCDNRSTEYLKLFVTLEDITDDDGPFHIMTQGRTKQLMKKGFGSRVDYNLSDEVINDPEYITKVTGKKGLAYFGNPQLCLHKAGTPTDGRKRDIIAFVFGPSTDPLSKNWFNNYEQDEGYFKASNEK
tara:strand:- start:5650 stop:6528 length:879 start_codon:yes stop_codon:yes gene_type:complete